MQDSLGLFGVEPEELLAKISLMPEHERKAILALLTAYSSAMETEACKTDFLSFVRKMWPAFISGLHHAIMAKAFERVASGELKRLIINMPPRHTKSEFASYLLPAWVLGLNPSKKIIQAAHTAELSVGFGRKVRNLVDSDAYKEVFPNTKLAADNKAAGRWNTNSTGEYFAIGVGGAVTGKGADLLIIDDCHSEQEAAIAAVDPSVFDRTYEWYTSGPRQRLQPGGAIVLVMTRWSKKDLTGRILDASDKRDGMDKWEVIEFPAIMPSGKPLWPEYWSLDLLESLKAELPLAKWQAQYQQSPTSEEGALIKREWWRPWEKKDPPKVEYLIMSVDTAFLKTERADYSACTVWGVFYNDDNKSGKTMPNVILLDAWQERLEFPALKKRVYEEYKRWNPESFLVEGKAAGMPLIFELRQLGIPVEEYTPSKGNDKISRVNAVASLFSSGMVWAPSTRWAEEVVEQCAEFPSGEHDDLVDTVSQALLRYRRGGFIRSPDDYIEETNIPKRAEFY